MNQKNQWVCFLWQIKEKTKQLIIKGTKTRLWRHSSWFSISEVICGERNFWDLAVFRSTAMCVGVDKFIEEWKKEKGPEKEGGNREKSIILKAAQYFLIKCVS